MSRPQLSRFILIVTVLLLAGAVLPPPVALGQAETPSPATTPTAGYTYTIQRGDSWSRISRQTGVSVATLKANNPQAIHPQDWLYQGERLFIPEATAIQPTPQSAADTGFWYQVKAGDAWGSVAKANGVTMQALLAANPSQVQPNRWLFTGQWIWIPGADSPTAPDRVTITRTPSPTLTLAPTATLVATATPEPTVTPSSTPTAEPTVTPSSTATPEPTVTPSSTPTVEPIGASATPDEQDALSAVTEAAATVAAAAEAAGLAASAAESAATAVAAANSIATSVAALSTQIALLNLATTPVVATPTPVATATGTPEEPTATPTPEAPTATPAAATQTPPALTATRAATSTRAATPTAIATRTRVPTRTPTTPPASAAQTTAGCLLDKVIVANQAFDRWGQDGFQTAIKLYQDVLADTTSKACGKTPNELELLRDYARFRLILSYVTSGQAKLAEPLHAQMEDTVVKDAADTFFEGLKTSGSIVQSCRYVIVSVQAKPADWRWLTELGLPAKPIDVCPMG